MIYRAVPHATARAQLGGLPPAALDALVEVLGKVIESPYDPLTTTPVEAHGDDRYRRAVFGRVGLVHFFVDDPAGVVVVYDVTWAG